MKAQVAEAKKDQLTVKFEELDQGMLNLIRDELWQDKATELAGFQITHPQVGEAVFTLKTKGKDSKSVWNSAVDRVNKQLDEVSTTVKKL